jgi:hypothetical protein
MGDTSVTKVSAASDMDPKMRSAGQMRIAAYSAISRNHDDHITFRL